MSLPPITIPDLDPAGPIDRVNDLLLLRQGLNDKKVTVQQIANLDLSLYSTLPLPIVATDKLLIGRNNGSGGYTNYLADPRTIGFLPGVTMWFYANTAPLYWQVDSSLSDRVLAVKGGSQAYTNFGTGGTWTQPSHTLTVTEMPSHSHAIDGMDSGKTSETRVGRGGTLSNPNLFTYPAGTAIKNTGGGAAHNHGSSYRPRAAIGICCLHIGTPS